MSFSLSRFSKLNIAGIFLMINFAKLYKSPFKKKYLEFELISHSTKIAISQMFGLENLFD